MSNTPASTRRAGPRFVLLFAAYYVAMHVLYLLLPDAWLAERAYYRLITAPAAAVIELLDADSAVRAYANRVVAPSVSLEVVRGCDGAGVLFLTWAAMLAFAAPWRIRAAGMAAAALSVWLMNGARVVALFFVVRVHPDWFTLLHAYLVPLVMIGVVCALFVAWARRAARDRIEPLHEPAVR